MTKSFKELRDKMPLESRQRADLLTVEMLTGFGKPASKTADWIVDTYMPGAPVSHRLSIEHAIAKAILDVWPVSELTAERERRVAAEKVVDAAILMPFEFNKMVETPVSHELAIEYRTKFPKEDDHG